MPKKKEELLEMDNNVDIHDTINLYNQLIKKSKEELANIQHNILLANSNLSSKQQLISSQQGEFEVWKKGQLAQLKKQEDKINTSNLDREHQLNLGEQDMVKRSKDLKEREKAVANLVEERNEIINNRIEVEKFRVSAKELMDRATLLMAQAQSKLNMAVQVENKAKVELDKINAINSELAVREEKLKIKQGETELFIKNLNEIQSAIEPKIQELKTIEANNKSLLDKIKIKEDDVNRKLEENKSIIKALDDRTKKLDQRERDLLGKEDDYVRKSLILQTKEKKG